MEDDWYSGNFTWTPISHSPELICVITYMMFKDCRDCPSGTRHTSEEFEYAEKEVKMEGAPPSTLFYLSIPVLEYLLYRERVTMGWKIILRVIPSSGKLTERLESCFNNSKLKRMVIDTGQ